MPLLPDDLINTDGCYVVQVAVGQPTGNGHLDRAEDVVPTGLEHLGHFLPRQPSGPAGQEPGIGGGQVVLASSPRDLFHLHAAGLTTDSAHGVEEEHGKAPQRHNSNLRTGRVS